MTPVDWAGWAAAAQRVLVDRFWNPRLGLFEVAARPAWLPSRWWRWPARPRLHWHYWWQAHALDATVDAGLRAPAGSADRRTAQRRIAAHVRGIRRRNGGRLANDYFDDMEWMALALQRADVLLGAGTAALGDELWLTIQQGWDARHGGIRWCRRGEEFTNTPSNGPAAILAARRYRHSGDPADLDWAVRITDWLHARLVDPDSGLVWDGIHPERGPDPGRTLYTYNHGVVVGADVELFGATGDPAYLRRARRVAAAAATQFALPPAGILAPAGRIDGGLFAGIFFRYLGELCQHGELSEPPHGAQERPGGAAEGPGGAAEGPASVAGRPWTMLRSNAQAVAAAAASGTVGPDWTQPRRDGGSLSTQLSAVLLLETVARLRPADVAGLPV